MVANKKTVRRSAHLRSNNAKTKPPFRVENNAQTVDKPARQEVPLMEVAAIGVMESVEEQERLLSKLADRMVGVLKKPVAIEPDPQPAETGVPFVDALNRQASSIGKLNAIVNDLLDRLAL